MKGFRDMIRRPMLFAAFGCSAAVVVSYYAGIAAVLCGAAAGVVAFAVLFVSAEDRKRLAAVLLLVFYCAGLAAYWHCDITLSRAAQQLSGESISGEIIDCEDRVSGSGEHFLQMTVRTENGKVLCKCYDGCFMEGAAAEGCGVDCKGRLQDPPVRRNPNCFDYSLYLRSLGITKTMRCDAVTVYPAEPFSRAPLSFIRNRVFVVREHFISMVTVCTDVQTSALIRALMFGDKGSLDEDVLDSFRKNGTAHILAVSGLHIGIIYGFILKLWRWRRGWVFLIFNTAFFVLYAAAAGFSPSVTRAVIMVLLHILAGIRSRRYDLANAAFLGFIGVILLNPFMVFNSGFQMSFLAVLSLTMVMPYLKRFYSGMFLASAAVQAGLWPFILYSFNYFPLLAVVVNVPIVALAGIIVPLALVSLALSLFAGNAFHMTAFLLKQLCEALTRFNEVTQIDDVTTFQAASPPLWAIAAYYLCLLLFATEEGRLRLIRASDKGRYIMRMALVIAVLSAVFAAFASDGYRGCEVTFVDVGQGDCVCVRADAGIMHKERCYLFDGGGSEDYNVGKKVLREYLLKNGISRVDGAFVTHLHTDHYKGICELSKEGMVGRIYVYEANSLKKQQIMEDTGLSEGQIVYLEAGDVVNLCGVHNIHSVYARILHPKRRTASEYRKMIADETDENLQSLVFKVTFSGRRGSTSVLITGDMGEEGEKELIRTNESALRTDILKVGHHGSKTSSTEEFMAAVSPETAVIQVGKNNMYGHPTPEAIERLIDAGADIYRTDLMGAVGIDIRGGKVRKIMQMIDNSE